MCVHRCSVESYMLGEVCMREAASAFDRLGTCDGAFQYQVAGLLVDLPALLVD